MCHMLSDFILTMTLWDEILLSFSQMEKLDSDEKSQTVTGTDSNLGASDSKSLVSIQGF